MIGHRLRTPAIAAAALIAGLLTAAPTPPAEAFGTVDNILLSQRAEHERITRALACGAVDAPRDCLGPNSIALLAGGKGTFGGVGAPDDPQEGLGPFSKHCDDADHYPNWKQQYPGWAKYKQSRADANEALAKCIKYYRSQLDSAVDEARGLVNKRGNLAPAQADIFSGPKGTIKDSCSFPKTGRAKSDRAKCAVMNRLGRALHVAEDFYSHTNWVDFPRPGGPKLRNPWGMGRTDLAPFLRYPASGGSLAGQIPPELISGCDDSIPIWGGVSCFHRISHGDLNKDQGTIDWRTGAATGPKTSRGKIVHDGRTNFERAVTSARAQARQTWSDFLAALETTYGARSAAAMVKSLTEDTPYAPCPKVTGSSPDARDPAVKAARRATAIEVEIRNQTSAPLHCTKMDLDAGEWVDYPDQTVGARADGVFRVQGRGDGRGAEAEVTYLIGDGPNWLMVTADNEPTARDRYRCEVTGSFSCRVVTREGHRSQMRVILDAG
ncbi:MAG: hypothetical protein Q8P61_04725 [Candidatus Nanopelagicales bacterium]|nr:hypothetical protein [Candidatus Nanopelagicales bacterium]